MKLRHRTETALLFALAACAAGSILIATSGTPIRAIGGIALVLVLPWVAASRLAIIRDTDTVGSRLSVAGSLAIAAIILVGLFFLLVGIGLDRLDLTVTILILICITVVLGGNRTDRSTSARSHRFIVGPALIVVALCGTVGAFFIARQGTLTETERNSSYAAFLVRHQGHFDIGLRNPTDRAAKFGIELIEGKKIIESRVTVSRSGLRLIPSFAATPMHNPSSSKAPAVKVHVIVTVNGRQKGSILSLIYNPPGGEISGLRR